MELEDLYRQKRSLENRIDSYFGEDDFRDHGDQGYQDLLEDLETVEEEIENIVKLKQ